MMLTKVRWVHLNQWFSFNGLNEVLVEVCIPATGGKEESEWIFQSIGSQWTKHYRYIYHTTSFDPTYCSKTKYCMRQSVVHVTAGCNKPNVVFNNGLLELQPAVMQQFYNNTVGCYLNH